MARWPDPDSESDFEPAFEPKPSFALDTGSDFAPLALKKPLARGKASDLGDVTSIADALADLGAYDKGRHGNPPLVPETLFRSIEGFQKDQGLDVDGVMLPGGPTLGRINALLPNARPKRVRSDGLQSPKAGPNAVAGKDDDGPSFADLYKQRLDAGEPQGFGPAFAPFEGSTERAADELDTIRAIPAQARQRRAPPRRPTAPVVPRAPAPQPDRTLRPPYPPARSLPPLAPPPEAPRLDVPEFGQRPIGPRPDGSVGTLLRLYADAIAYAEGIRDPRRTPAEYATVHRNSAGVETAWGRYQFTASGLRAAQVLGPTGAWDGPLARAFGITSAQEFLDNPAAQEEALRRFILGSQDDIRRNRLDRLIGRTVEGLDGRFVITLPGLVAAIHRHGLPGVLRHLAALERRRFRSRPGDRLSDQERNIETRLRVFSSEAMSTE